MYNVTLPNGAELKYQGKQVDLGIVSGKNMSALTLLDSVAFKDQPKLMASRFMDLFIMWRLTDPNEYEKTKGKPVRVQKWRAYEVLFNLCVKSVDVNVRFAQSQTNITDVEFELDTTNGTMSSQCSNDTKPTQDVTLLSTSDKATFGTGMKNLDGLASTLSPQFQGFFTEGANSYTPGVFSETLFNAFFATGENNQSISEQEELQVGEVKKISQNVADILTNASVLPSWVRVFLLELTVSSIRKGPKGAASFDTCKDIVGIEYQENMIKVRWEWLMLLVIQVLVSIVFLVLVIIQTHSLQVDVLKSQLLPVLLAVSPDGKSAVLRDEIDKDVVNVQRQAPRVAAGLENQGMGWALRKRVPGWL